MTEGRAQIAMDEPAGPDRLNASRTVLKRYSTDYLFVPPEARCTTCLRPRILRGAPTIYRLIAPSSVIAAQTEASSLHAGRALRDDGGISQP